MLVANMLTFLPDIIKSLEQRHAVAPLHQQVVFCWIRNLDHNLRWFTTMEFNQPIDTCDHVSPNILLCVVMSSEQHQQNKCRKQRSKTPLADQDRKDNQRSMCEWSPVLVWRTEPELVV